MSRQRAHSSQYRTFPWEEPDFDPQKVLAQLDGMPLGWGEGDGPREPWRERRPYQQQGRRSEESHTWRRNSPFHEPEYIDMDEGPRHREEFRENRGRYEDRREDETPNRNYAQREPGWRQEQPERGSSERFRDRSPMRRDNGNNRNYRQRGRGRGRGQYRANLVLNDKWTPNQDDQQHFNRDRRDMDGSPRSGYEREEQHFSADERREGFYRNEHEFIQKRNEPMEPLRHERYSPDRDMDRQRSRSLSREDMRGGHFEEDRSNDDYCEDRSSFDERPNHNQYRDRPANRRGSRGNFNRRGRFFRRGRGWGRGRGNRPQAQRVQNPPNEAPRFREEDEFLDEPGPSWEQKEVDQEWEDDQDCDRERPDPQEPWGRNNPKTDMMVITEETLTIKVDMSRPVNKNSLMLYSADRPLSLDLVHVGRQRLDFLTSAENPGPNRENLVHAGTFAQEIITLVHQVKEQYFGGQGITLSERFSSLQSGEFTNEEQGMTLNKRFSSNRGLNINYNSLPDREEPLFSKQGPLQLLGAPPLRDPDDLRHDLEKRRQERLEGVKVTISGQGQPQRPPGEQMYGDDDMLEEEFPNWRQEGPKSPRRGGSFRPFRGNNRPMRRPNFRNNSRGGQNW